MPRKPAPQPFNGVQNTSALTEHLSRQFPEVGRLRMGSILRETFRAITDSVLQQVQQGLPNPRVQILGFGNVTAITLKARMARNPRTGETLAVGERYALRWHPSDALRAALKAGGAKTAKPPKSPKARTVASTPSMAVTATMAASASGSEPYRPEPTLPERQPERQVTIQASRGADGSTGGPTPTKPGFPKKKPGPVKKTTAPLAGVNLQDPEEYKRFAHFLADVASSSAGHHRSRVRKRILTKMLGTETTPEAHV